jgi:hypothetical protein
MLDYLISFLDRLYSFFIMCDVACLINQNLWQTRNELPIYNRLSHLRCLTEIIAIVPVGLHLSVQT